MQRICRTFRFKDNHYESVCLSRDSWSCATRSLDLCILLKFLFLYLWYIPPHSCAFHTLCFHQFFQMYITMRNVFLIPDDAVDRRKLGILMLIFNFSQTPHLNYKLFYSLTFVDLNFHKIEVVTCSNLPTKLQAMLSFFNRIESVDDVSSFFLKLSAILFYGGIHCKPLKLCNKSRRSG